MYRVFVLYGHTRISEKIYIDMGKKREMLFGMDGYIMCRKYFFSLEYFKLICC